MASLFEWMPFGLKRGYRKMVDLGERFDTRPVFGDEVSARQQITIAGPLDLTRPNNTTAYAAQRSVADVSSGAVSIDVAPYVDCPVALIALRLNTADTGPGAAPNASFSAYIYNQAPTPAVDGAVFVSQQAGLVGIMRGSFNPLTDGSFARLVPVEGRFILCKPAAGARNIWVVLRTHTAYTPSVASAVYQHRMEVLPGHA